MAKSDNDSPFGDIFANNLKKVKLNQTRQFLPPVSPWLSFEQYLMICVKEGMAMLEAEEKEKTASVTAPVPKQVLDDTLGKMSKNPYVRARIQILQKMTSKARSVIEEMEKGSLDKDRRYDKFVKAVADLGDKLSK